MFKKVLIANRGEIACRIIKTARRLGVQSVAVFSDVDANALHVQMADEAIHLGGAQAADSYLSADKILQAAAQTGADALHPGYGFLSENAPFAKSCEKAGLLFIGPHAEAILRMGDKIESKILAQKASVNRIPASPALESAEEAGKIAASIGYPVMIKAAAGGGGKGMRVARSAEGLRNLAASAMREAEAAFGDKRVFIEKYIENARHIEIQILCDKHGGALHLGERECSIQRRNQKIIEEAPSPFLDEAMRAAMSVQALDLAKAVQYDSAGTVEFIVDGAKNFYFLEMNTRLQVEHPVTELITGFDLVEEMFRVAIGEPLRHSQKDVRFTGWAFEARLYAEDPERGFLPSTGYLSSYRMPENYARPQDAVRADAGVEEGDRISIYYDPMIAKLCTLGASREAARKKMLEALESLELEGVAHNRLLLSALFAHPRFAKGDLSTSFLEEVFPDGFKAECADESLRAAARAAALFAHLKETETKRALPQEGEEVFLPHSPQSLAVLEGEDILEYAITREGEGVRFSSKHESLLLQSGWHVGEKFFKGTINGKALLMQIRRKRKGWLLFAQGARFLMRVATPSQAALMQRFTSQESSGKADVLLCPMPGQITQIHVQEGDQVRAGQPLLHVEAMKMENILYAEHDALVKEILCEEGATLALDDPIIRFS